MSSQEAVDSCRGVLRKVKVNSDETTSILLDKRDIAKILVSEALRRGSMDNISVLVIWLA